MSETHDETTATSAPAVEEKKHDVEYADEEAKGSVS